MALEIAFPQLASADASRLAQELRGKLVEQGMPAKGVAVQRGDPENMDWGEILYFTNLAIEGFIATHGVFQLANIIHEFATKHQSVLLLKTELGTILHVKADSAVAAISELLKKLEAGSGERPKE
jgi:hypothetical protein